MQDAGEDGALDGDAELAIGQEGLDACPAPALVPEQIKYQGDTDPTAVDRSPAPARTADSTGAVSDIRRPDCNSGSSLPVPVHSSARTNVTTTCCRTLSP